MKQLAADVAVGHAEQEQFGDLAFPVGQPRRGDRRSPRRHRRPDGSSTSRGRTGRSGRGVVRNGRDVVRIVGRCLELARQLQHHPRHPGIRGLQRGLAGQPGRIPGQPELGEPAGRRRHLLDVDLIGQHPQPRPPGSRQGLRRRRCRRPPRSAPDRAGRPHPASWPGSRRAPPPNAAAPTTAAAGRGARAGPSPRRGDAAAGPPGAAARPRPTIRPTAAGSRGRASTRPARPCAAYQCLLHGAAVAGAAGDRGVQRGRPQCVPAVQVPVPRPPRHRRWPRSSWPSCIRVQPSSSRCRWRGERRSTARPARPMMLRARTGSPPWIAASVTSAAGLSGDTDSSDHSEVIDRLKPADGGRERPVQGVQQSVGQAAGGAGRRRGRARILDVERRPGPRRHRRWPPPPPPPRTR